MSTEETGREPFKHGDEFLQYRILSLLGRGGHALVYAAQHRYMERPVAIKVIPAPVGMNTEIHKRAQLEAQVLSQLEHPNVVKVYDAGVTSTGLIYIVMEMLEGWTLRAALKSLRSFTVPETLQVGIQIASAVQMAHAQQAIHRDIKPENVFVLPGNKVKVLDFGITKLVGANDAMTTQPQLIRGTPQYMSPEHMEGLAVTVRSDIYALGSVLYELLAAVAPALIGLQEVSSYAIGYSQVHRMPPRLDELLPNVPRYVARSIQRMIAKDPSERHASMREVAAELRQLQSRFASEAPAAAGSLRELWHAPLLERCGANPEHSPTTLWVPCKPTSSNAERGAIQSPRFGPGPRLPQNQPALRAPDAMALRLADRHSSSAPVPVTLQRTRSRAPSHAASFLILAVVLGGIIGYGALMSFRRNHWANRPPQGSNNAAVAAPFGASAAGLLATAPAVASLSAAPTTNGKVSGATLAHASSASANSGTTTENVGQPPPRTPGHTHAPERDLSTGQVSKDASQKSAVTKAPTATARAAHSASKDQLLFGAEDLTW
jgi:serine/threonine-protein kinase